jgi:hypothetical protein
MAASTLTHGVSINETANGRTEVSIEIESSVEGGDAQAVLASAYAQLSQAIAEHKQTLADANPDKDAGPNPEPQSETAADAPGSGAWWSQ